MDFLPTDEQTDRDDRQILGWTVAFAAASTVGAALWNPLNLDPGPYFPIYVWAAGLVFAVALVHAARWSCRQRVDQEVATVLGVLATVVASCFGAMVVLLVLDLGTDDELPAVRGRTQLVQVQHRNLIDPVYRVELRRGIGPLRQTVVVWQGLPERDPAAGALFVGPHEIVVRVPRYPDRICEHRTSFHPLTLEPARPQRDDHGDVTGC